MHRARNEFYVVPAPYCYWTRGEPVWMVTVVCGLIPTSEFASRISIAEDLPPILLAHVVGDASPR
jgi:hypothetical protein